MMNKCLNGFVFISIALVACSSLHAESREIIKFGKDIVVKEGEKVSNAVAIGGDVTVYGDVDDEVVAIGGSVYLGPDAYVRGDVVSIGGDINKEIGAKIRGDLVEIDIPGIPFIIHPFRYIGWSIFWPFRIISLIAFVGLTVLIVAIFPTQIEGFSSTVKENVPGSFLWGLLGILLIVPLAVLLCVSLVGIPLVPVEFLLILCAFLVGYIAVARVLGNKITEALSKPNQPILLDASVGIMALWVLGLIPILGWIIKTIIAVVGFGSVIATFISKRKSSSD